MAVSNLIELLFSVESGIIQNNNRLLRKTWQKALFKPGLKQCSVGRTCILHRGQDLLSHFCSNNIGALELPSRNFTGNGLSPRRVGVFPVKVRIQPGFVYIDQLIFRRLRDFSQVLLDFFLFLFLIPVVLFFRVIFSRSRALDTALSLHPNASPISR